MSARGPTEPRRGRGRGAPPLDPETIGVRRSVRLAGADLRALERIREHLGPEGSEASLIRWAIRQAGLPKEEREP